MRWGQGIFDQESQPLRYGRGPVVEPVEWPGPSIAEGHVRPWDEEILGYLSEPFLRKKVTREEGAGRAWRVVKGERPRHSSQNGWDRSREVLGPSSLPMFTLEGDWVWSFTEREVKIAVYKSCRDPVLVEFLSGCPFSEEIIFRRRRARELGEDFQGCLTSVFSSSRPPPLISNWGRSRRDPLVPDRVCRSLKSGLPQTPSRGMDSSLRHRTSSSSTGSTLPWPLLLQSNTLRPKRNDRCLSTTILSSARKGVPGVRLRWETGRRLVGSLLSRK